MRNNQIAYHSYTDDTQIYLALSPNDYSPIDSQVKNLGVILETDISFSKNTLQICSLNINLTEHSDQ